MNRDVRFSTSVDLKFEGETGNACEYDLPCRCPKCVNENDTITK